MGSVDNDFSERPSDSADFIDGLGLTQAARIANVAGNGLSEPLSNLFVPGKYYLLTALYSGGGGGMQEGASFRVSLQYQSAGKTIEMSGNTAIFRKDMFFATNRMEGFDFFSPTIASADPWSGQPMLLQIEVVSSPEKEGGFWLIDDVRLTEIDPLYIPGPGEIDIVVALTVELRGDKTRLWWYAPSQWQFQLQRSLDLKTWQDYGSLRYGGDTDMYEDVPVDESTNAFFVLNWNNQPRP